MSETPPNLVCVPGAPVASPRRPPDDHRPAILHVAGARPDLVRMAPVILALERRGAFHQVLVHTGQQHDTLDDLLAELGLHGIDRFLGVGSGSRVARTARVLGAIEPVLAETEPAVLVVAGGAGPTLACALAAAKLGIAIAHLGSGVRPRDEEELGRALTERLADTLFAAGRDAVAALEAEGIDPERIHDALAGVRPVPQPPAPGAIPLWDGRAGERVAGILVANYALTVGAGGCL